METTSILGYTGIMEKRMETTTVYMEAICPFPSPKLFHEAISWHIDYDWLGGVQCREVPDLP